MQRPLFRNFWAQIFFTVLKSSADLTVAWKTRNLFLFLAKIYRWRPISRKDQAWHFFKLCWRLLKDPNFFFLEIQVYNIGNDISKTICYKFPISRENLTLIVHSVLFTNWGFVLDEKFQRNASIFAILLTKENPKLLFPFFISCYFIFFPNECPGLCRQIC